MRAIGVTVRRSPWVGEDPHRLSDFTIIGSDVWIGYGAIILSGVRLGDSCVVAAGAIVTNDVPSNTIVAGTPARIVGARYESEDFKKHWQILESKGIKPMQDGI
ncbi:hypothetical protein AS188_07615 [Kocuria flava]|nr:hypothetical protein AS188_07615 [Kocuria flava]